MKSVPSTSLRFHCERLTMNSYRQTWFAVSNTSSIESSFLLKEANTSFSDSDLFTKDCDSPGPITKPKHKASLPLSPSLSLSLLQRQRHRRSRAGRQAAKEREGGSPPSTMMNHPLSLPLSPLPLCHCCHHHPQSLLTFPSSQISSLSLSFRDRDEADTDGAEQSKHEEDKTKTQNKTTKTRSGRVSTTRDLSVDPNITTPSTLQPQRHHHHHPLGKGN